MWLHRTIIQLILPLLLLSSTITLPLNIGNNMLMLSCRPLTIITSSLLSPEKEEATCTADVANIGQNDYDNYNEDKFTIYYLLTFVKFDEIKSCVEWLICFRIIAH